MPVKRVGLLIYTGVVALDVAGPMDAFAAAAAASGVAGYDVFAVGLDEKSVRAESGLLLAPQYTIESAPRLDTLIIPGGRALREGLWTSDIVPWLRAQVRRTRRIASVCTGAYALAAAGLLDGRRVTTHWRYAEDLAQQYPALRVDPDAIFLKDGPYYTSAGITAGLDLALALIDEDYGPSAALAVARELVMYLRRTGGQTQFSDPLKFQIQSPDRLSDVAGWIVANLDKELSLEALAERARLCPRQFSRRFKSAFGVTPGTFVERARLDEARRRLAANPVPVERVALSVGYRSVHVFRRAFERTFGVAPNTYRHHFPETS